MSISTYAGFRVLRDRESEAFLNSTKWRMRTFTELALDDEDQNRAIRDAAATMTARRARGSDAAHDAAADRGDGSCRNREDYSRQTVA